MSSSGKLILSLAVLFCVAQAISARPRFDGTFLENVRYDLIRKCVSLEKDFNKEVLNINHKLMKDSMKLMKKAVKEGASECIESARLEAEKQVEEKSEEIQGCIEEQKNSLDSGLSPESGLAEIMVFRSSFKNQLQQCKNSGKAGIKAIQNSFALAGKACLV